MKNEDIERLFEFLEGKRKVFSRLTGLYEGGDDNRAHMTESFAKDLKEISNVVASWSGQGWIPAESEKAMGNLGRFALIIEVAAEFTVNFYRTKEAAEKADFRFREYNEDLILGGEVSSDVVELTSTELESSGLSLNHFVYFFACGLDGRMDISLFPDKMRRDEALREFQGTDEYDPNEHLVGSGIVFFN